MMTKILSVAAVFILLLIACKTEKPKQTQALPEEVLVPKVADTFDYAIIPFNKDDAWLVTTIFPKEMVSTSLEASELEQLQLSLQAFILKCNSEPENVWMIDKDEHPGGNFKSYNLKITLEDYKKQYMPVINIKGEKEVWVNCFCKSIEQQIEFTEWRKIAVRVSGGGSCFFNMKLNLTKGHIYDFAINPESEKQTNKN